MRWLHWARFALIFTFLSHPLWAQSDVPYEEEPEEVLKSFSENSPEVPVTEHPEKMDSEEPVFKLSADTPGVPPVREPASEKPVSKKKHAKKVTH